MTTGSVQSQIARRFTPTVRQAEPGWITAETLISDPARLSILLEAQRRTPRGYNDTAAGSLLVLEYSRLLTWPVLGTRLSDGALLDPGTSNVIVRHKALEPGGLAFQAGPRCLAPYEGSATTASPSDRGPLDSAVDGLVEHLMQLGDAVRRRVRIGQRTVRANIAAAVAGGLLALSWLYPPRDRYLPLALRLIDNQPELRGLVDLTGVDHDRRPWMAMARNACCLAYGEGPPHDYCGTCPILDEYERVERFHHTASRYLVLTQSSER